MQMTGNTIVITGGTSGIGRALAEAFYRRGNTVIIAGRRQQLLDEISAANPGMIGAVLDVQNSASIAAFAGRLTEEFPTLNVLVNNAGIMQHENLSDGEIDLAGIRALIETNIISVVHLTAALLPLLKRQQSSALITTTSGLAFTPLAPFPSYCASKAYLHSWLQSLRFQLAGSSVQVLELAPPYVQTELSGAHQASDPAAMPLADFIAEVMTLLERADPDTKEILVERVKDLRNAERSGRYDEVFNALNSLRF